SPPVATGGPGAIRNRVKQLRLVRGIDLAPNPDNWRTHPKAQRDAMQGLLEEIGFAGAALAYETPAGLQLIDGHLRAELSPEQEIPVLLLDVTEAEAKKLLLTFDPITALAEADTAKLDALLREVQTASEPVAKMLEQLAIDNDVIPPEDADDKIDTGEIERRFDVLVHCKDEPDQKAVLTELDRHGLDIRALTVDFPLLKPRVSPPVATGGETAARTITRTIAIKRSPRVIQCEGLFDIPPSKKATEEWSVELTLDKPWNIGLIVGPSGSGKSTVATELFAKDIVTAWPWAKDKALIDDFPKALSIADITALLSSVGFSSPPSWLKPFHVLSNGEQFRVTLARTLAEKPDLAVMDEFTSVVDRTVAQIGSAALAKTIRAANRQFIAVACHYDIEDWLQPDWKLEMPSAELTWRSLRRRPPIQLRVRRTHSGTWQLFRRHHYLSHALHPGSQCFLAEVVTGAAHEVSGPSYRPAAFTAVLHCPNAHGGFFREHRTVCLPDFQGVGIGDALSEFVAGVMAARGKGYGSTTSHPAMIRHRLHSPLWRCIRKPKLATGSSNHVINASRAAYRLTAGFAYAGPPNPTAARALGILA
ncbi:MAG TPA: hypothetical protein VGP44_10760, partial [Gemmatimonadales bacterium]|nr:hypothetical protein [Gemmatimonadales bacterium]